jgi:Family of unknown function (DUF5343)
LDQSQSDRVLADGIREAFADLFQVNVNAQTLSKNELINKFKTLSQGQLSDSVMDKMALTFAELSKLADFNAAGAAKEPPKGDLKDDDKKKDPPKEVTGKIKVDGLVYNIQIVLPESREQAVYDALFRSLREHLG